MEKLYVYHPDGKKAHDALVKLAADGAHTEEHQGTFRDGKDFVGAVLTRSHDCDAALEQLGFTILPSAVEALDASHVKALAPHFAAHDATGPAIGETVAQLGRRLYKLHGIGLFKPGAT